MNTKKQVLVYWKNPEEKNEPSQYALKKSYWIVVAMVKKYLSPDATILELGCNIGLNLYHLSKAGYKNLSAIEINSEAVRLMKITYPTLDAKIYNASIEESIKKIKAHDLIFSKAVLCHVHPDSNWVFEKIANRAKKYIFTFEDEVADGTRHCPRNYRDVFEPFGFEQVEEVQKIRGMVSNYRGRIFRRAAG